MPSDPPIQMPRPNGTSPTTLFSILDPAPRVLGPANTISASGDNAGKFRSNVIVTVPPNTGGLESGGFWVIIVAPGNSSDETGSTKCTAVPLGKNGDKRSRPGRSKNNRPRGPKSLTEFRGFQRTAALLGITVVRPLMDY